MAHGNKLRIMDNIFGKNINIGKSKSIYKANRLGLIMSQPIAL